MKHSPEMIGIATLAAIAGVQLYADLMPSRTDVLNAHPGSMDTDLRHGEVMTGAIVLFIGSLVGLLAHSMLPVYIAATTVVALTVAYEVSYHYCPGGEY
jgi:hypothetical protein